MRDCVSLLVAAWLTALIYLAALAPVFGLWLVGMWLLGGI